MTNLINWANSKLLDLTFIEVMPMSDTDMPRHMQFVSLDKIYKELNDIYVVQDEITEEILWNHYDDNHTNEK